MIHPLDPDDGAIVNAIRAATSSTKGSLGGIEARAPFDALMEGVLPRNDVTFETETIGGVPGLWVRPIASPAGAAILHLHAGWFMFGTANAYRHLAGHIAARAGVKAFILSDAAEGVITGFGVYGYLLALDAILHLLNESANVS